MRLLDRLDAIDRRLGLRRPLRKPPNRWTRWLAAHLWAAGLIHAVILIAALQLTGLLFDGEISLGSVVIQALGGFLLGVLVATTARKDCEAWDRRSEA